MGNEKEKMIALCKSPGHCVQAPVPPLGEERGSGRGSGSDWEQEGRPKSPYLKPMRGTQPRPVEYRYGTGEGCSLYLVPRGQRGIESQQRKYVLTQCLDCGTHFHRKRLKPRIRSRQSDWLFFLAQGAAELGVNTNEHFVRKWVGEEKQWGLREP